MTVENKPNFWLSAFWSTMPVIIAIILVVFILVAISSFQWHLVLNVFRVLWPAFAVIIAFVYTLFLLTMKYPIGTITTGLMLIAFTLLLASQKGNYIADELRGYITDNFEINYFLGAITVIALALAFSTIRMKDRKSRR